MIYTFYSYKGGVGRTMALANVAELFCQTGLNVLMVDWDLEAPGLERFFFNSNTMDKILTKPGIMDMLQDYKTKMTEPWPEMDGENNSLPFAPLSQFMHPISPTQPPTQDSTRGKLWLIPPGKRDKNPTQDHFTQYAHNVLNFDWQDFYDNWEGERYIEWLRQQLNQAADVVLIDSRTGVTEMGGICTYQLADVVVMFCAANRQNIAGTTKMLHNFKRPEVDELRERPLNVVIVPARIENAESNFLNEFQKDFQKTFAPHTPPQLGGPNTTRFWQLAIPYIPYYAYKEKIAIQDMGKESAKELIDSFSQLTFSLSRLAPKDSAIQQALPETEIQIGDEKVIGAIIGKQLVVVGDSVLIRELEPTSTVFFDPPSQSSPHFVGRKEELTALTKALTKSSVIGLWGMGGVGKTALAKKLATMAKEQFQKKFVIIDASIYEAETILQSNKVNTKKLENELLKACLSQNNNSSYYFGREDLQEKISIFHEILDDTKRLIIIDNVDDIDIARQLISPTKNNSSQFLFTTRNRKILQFADFSLEIKPFTEQEGLELLTQVVGTQVILDNMKETKEIIRLLGGLPLSLSIIAGVLKEVPDLTLSDYYQELVHRKMRLEDIDTNHQHNVKVTFERSYNLLSKSLKEVFVVSSILPNHEFDSTAVIQVIQERSGLVKRHLTELYDQALINRNLANDASQVSYYLHPLLKDFAQYKLETDLGYQAELYRKRAKTYFDNLAKTDQ